MPHAITRRTVLGTALAGSAALTLPGTANAETTADGQALYDLVDAYAAIGAHQTGTRAAKQTADWLTEQLEARGAQTSRQRYEFQRYEAEAGVRIDGREVEAIPYDYEGTGEATATAPYTATVTLANSAGRANLDKLLQNADKAGAGLAVIATEHAATGAGTQRRLVHVASGPARVRTGIPTLLVSGAESAALATGNVEAQISAKRTKAKGYNVIGWFGEPTDTPVVIAASYTGRFASAAERGPGLAIGLALAERLHAAGRSVLFVAVSGVELEHYGLNQFLQTLWSNVAFAPQAVIVLGPSIAAGVKAADGTFTFAPSRSAGAQPALSTQPAVAAALQTAGFAPGALSLSGEAALAVTFLPPETRFLALAGTFAQYRTPDDVAAETTSPELLAAAAAAIDAAVDLILA